MFGDPLGNANGQLRVQFFGVPFYQSHRIGMARLMRASLKWRVHLGESTMIRKLKEGYKVLSEDGKKNLGGPYKTKAEAQKRLRQVEYFKHQK
jgi:hypothetical protein